MSRLLMVTTVPCTLRAFFLPLVRRLRERGWRVDAAARGATSDPECVRHYSRVWDIPWSRNPLDPRNLLTAPPAVRALVAAEGYDLVHVHTPVAAFVSRLALRRQSLPRKPRVIYTAHGFHFHPRGSRFKNAIFQALERLAGRWTDYLIVINQDDLAAARHLGLVPPERLVYVPGVGIDTEHFNPDKVPSDEVQSVRRDLGLAADAPLFLMVAELIPRKRPADALDAFARLAHPRAHLALAGDGPLRNVLRRRAERLGVAARVHLLGYRRDVPVLVRASAAVLLVSNQEGLGMALAEALSLEVPVIGTDIRGTRELLMDGCGFQVPVGDVVELARAMSRILDDPAQAAAMARRGRERMRAHFELSTVLDMHDEVYSRALAGHSVSDIRPAPETLVSEKSDYGHGQMTPGRSS